MLLYLSLLESDEDRASFQEMYENNYKLMLYLAYIKLHDHARAEDAVHNAFMKIMERFQFYKSVPPAKVRSLCCIIAKTKALDMIKTDPFMKTDDINNLRLHLAERDEQPLEILLHEENRTVISKALSSMKEKNRLILELKYYHNLSSRHIGEIMDMHEKTINVKLHRAKKQLKDLLIKDGYHYELFPESEFVPTEIKE